MPEPTEDMVIAAGILPFIFDRLNELEESEREALIKLALNGFIDGDAEAHTILKIGYSFDLVHKEALEYSKEYADMLTKRGGSYCTIPIFDDAGEIIDYKSEFLPWAKDYNTAQRKLISDAIKTGIAEGKSVRNMAKDLDEIFDARDKRAEILVQTESRKHHTEGMKTRYKANGVKKVEWSTAGSGVCPLCAPMQGTTYPVDEAPGGGPPLHPRCRCRLLPVIDWDSFEAIEDDEFIESDDE